MFSPGHEREQVARRRDELEREVAELRRSINATRTHGIFYYFLLVAIFFVGFAVGYATHRLVGAVIILIGLAIVNSVLPLLPGRSLQRLLLVLGVDFYVNLLLLLAVVYVMLATARPAPTRFGERRMSSLSTTRTS